MCGFLSLAVDVLWIYKERTRQEKRYIKSSLINHSLTRTQTHTHTYTLKPLSINLTDLIPLTVPSLPQSDNYHSCGFSVSNLDSFSYNLWVTSSTSCYNVSHLQQAMIKWILWLLFSGGSATKTTLSVFEANNKKPLRERSFWNELFSQNVLKSSVEICFAITV